MSLLIFIHMTKAEDVVSTILYLHKTLKYLYPEETRADRDGWTIDVGQDVMITFRSGEDPAKVAGLRPDYYYSDDGMVRDWIVQGAAKVGGRQIRDINQVLTIVSLYIGFKKFVGDLLGAESGEKERID